MDGPDTVSDLHINGRNKVFSKNSELDDPISELWKLGCPIMSFGEINQTNLYLTHISSWDLESQCKIDTPT